MNETLDIAPSLRERFHGCLLGGAVGDALGAPVEFMSLAQIRAQFGPAGLDTFAPAYGQRGAITDDTQMTLFTAEGLIRAQVRGKLRGITTWTGVTAHAYLRWLETQGDPAPRGLLMREAPGWLVRDKRMHARRAPGNTCLSALGAMRGLGEPARNDRKGCGGVMRVAPAGLLAARLTRADRVGSLAFAFDLGADLAGLTHGHPSGRLPSGALAAVVHQLALGDSLHHALAKALALLRTRPDHAETLAALEQAIALAAAGGPAQAAISQLGEGWVASEALAVAVYCALVARNFREGVLLAVNHDGDSDSTGSIAGNILGAALGAEAIPTAWREDVELADVVVQLADDLHDCVDWPLGEYEPENAAAKALRMRYPGC